MRRSLMVRLVVAGTLLAISGWQTTLGAIIIDPGVPPGHTSSGPLSLPVPFVFKTSYDNIQWTEEQKQSARQAIAYLGSFFVDQPAFEEKDDPNDFSIRWAGNDLFKDWSGGGWSKDWDYSNALAMAVKPRPDNSTPWPQDKYPYNEIYINNTVNWHYDPFSDPAEGDPNVEGDGEYDFWSVLLHEVIHMLCVDTHASDPDEVMYAYFSDGERRWELKESDKELLRQAGYKIVPEPAAVLVWLMVGLLIVRFGHRRGRA